MGLLSKAFGFVKKVTGLGFVLDKLKDWLTPDFDNSIDSIKVMRQGSNNDLPVVYGRQKVGGVIVHKYVTDQSGGAENDTLNLIVAFAEGEVDEIEELFFDDVSETDPKYGGVISKFGFNIAYKWLNINKHTGAEGQQADSSAVANIPNWTNDHKMSGLAYCYIQLIVDKNHEVWNGEPQITAIIKGKKVYDPRTQTTEFSTNPAVCLRDYLTNPIYGKGLAESRIDESAFIAAANFCDEQVTVTETISEGYYDTQTGEYVNTTPSTQTKSINRFTCNLIVNTSNSVIDNAKTIMGTFRCILPPDYILSPVIEREENIIETISDDDLIGAVEYSSGSITDRFNSVSVKYNAKLSNYETEEVTWPNPDADIYATWLEEDGGRKLEKSFTFDGIDNKAEALQMAEIIAKRSRFSGSVGLAMQAKGIKYQVGDVLGLDNETMGWDSKPFRIREKVLSPEGDISLSLSEHENSVYPWSDVAYEDREGGTYLGNPSYIPAPQNFDFIADLTFTTFGRLTWDIGSESAFLRGYRISVYSYTGSDGDYTTVGESVFADFTVSKFYDLPIFGLGEYVIEVTSVSTLGYISEPASYFAEFKQSIAPYELEVIVGDWDVYVKPIVYVLDDQGLPVGDPINLGIGATFEYDWIKTSELPHEPSVKAKGSSITINGLLPETEYTIYARSFSATGVSDWVLTEVTTTAEGDQVEAFLNPINLILDDVRDELNDAIQDIIDTRNEIDGTLKPALQLETLNRESSDLELFNTTSALVQFRQQSQGEFDSLTNAVFEVNPDNGTLNLRAYSYTDSVFTQAGVLIDGVDARVTINASRIEEVNDGVINANASIDVLAGQIELKASYTEMTEYVNGALDAIIPAYSFGFFNSSEGWTAVNGAITQGSNLITTTWGDIENQSLSYSADENPVITLNYMRIAGSGFTGDLIVTFQGGSTQTYTGVISGTAIDSTNVQNLNLSEEITYTGTVTGLRIILGGSTSDEWEIDSITIGKPSSELEALDGITAQVNQLGIDVDAIEGQLTSFVTTTYYDENTVTLNNVTQVLDGEEAIISLKATQQELDDEGTITKANSASIWVDGAEGNIRTEVVSFNAEPGSIDDQITGLTGDLNTVIEEVSTIDGARIRTQLTSLNNAQIENQQVEELQFWAQSQLIDQKAGLLSVGDSVATVDTQVKALADDQGALAQEIVELTASTGTIQGQVDAVVTRVSQAETGIDGNAQAISAIQTEVSNTQDDLSSAELILDSTVDELGEVSSRAYLGVSETVDGKTTVTGITADSSTNGLRFQGDVIQFNNTDGSTALQYRDDLGQWTFNGRIVVGGNYVVDSEEDIRALDGDTIYEKYQYSVTGTSGWHNTFVNGDLFRRAAIVTNGVVGTYSAATRITGYTPAIVTNPDGSVTISNGTETATVYDGNDGESAPIPTLTDNGDGTYTIDNGAGETVTVSDGQTPIKGVDYFDGLDGSFVSSIYITSGDGVPATPTGGSFDGSSETFPTGWQDSPYYIDEQITYISKTRYKEVTAGVWQQDGWSAPSEYIIKGDKGDSTINFYTSAGDFSFDGTNYVKQSASGWNTGLSSKETFVHATASARISSTSRIMIGLSYESSMGDFTKLNFALYSDEGILNVYESGIRRITLGSVSSANVLSVVWDGVSVKYYKDAELVHTSTIQPTLPLLFDLCALNTGDTFSDPLFAATGSGGEDGADGQAGAGFYGSTYTAISWTTSTANDRFQALVGRAPVNGDILTQTRLDGADSQARQYNGSSWVAVALQVNGSIVASGTIAGDKLIAGTEIITPVITGGKIVTDSGTGTRIELEDDGTYLIWAGAGSKTDSNATMFIKKDGTGFVSGSFFSGQIIESKFNQGTTSATITHNSAGNDVELTMSSNGSATVIAGSAPSPVGASTYTLPYSVTRGATTLESGNLVVTRVVEYEAAEGEYTTRDYYNFSTTVVDTGTASADYTYSVTVGQIPLSTRQQKTNVRSYEDLFES